jgi:hypothetical protein
MVQYIFGQCCQCLTRHSMGHQLAASIIYNLQDCSVSSLSAFHCQYGSLPSLLAYLWTHHPSAWHFVVVSAAFTFFHSCIGFGVTCVSHGFQARLNETHFWLLQAVAAPYFLVAWASKMDLHSIVHYVPGIYWPVMACFLVNMLQSRDGYCSQ